MSDQTSKEMSAAQEILHRMTARPAAAPVTPEETDLTDTAVAAETAAPAEPALPVSGAADEETVAAEAETEAETATETDEEDVKIYHPREEVRVELEETPPARRRHDTRILDFVRRRGERTRGEAARPDTQEMPQLDGQMTFEGMEEPPAATEQELEAQVQDARRKKVESFHLVTEVDGAGDGKDAKPNAPFRLTGEEEPSGEEPEEPAVLEDYNAYEETAAVRAELNYRRRSGWLGLWFSCLVEFVLLCLMLLAQFSSALPMEPITYLTLNLALLVVLMLTANRVVADGLTGLVRGHATADSLTAGAAAAAVVHTVLQYVNLTEVANGAVTLYNAVAGLALVLSLCGRQARICRICRSFRLVSYQGDKYAALCVPPGRQNEQLGRVIGSLGEPKVAYMKKSGFLTRFMANSYDGEGHEGLFRWFSPVLLGAALLIAVVYALLPGETANWWNAVGVFTALLAAGAPAFAVAGANLPLNRAGRRLLPRGAALVNWRAAERFSDTNGLMVDASEVFPGETMRLHGIKTFSGARIDEAILDAAAVSIEAGGPLAAVFRRVIENRLDMLQPVDTLLYEQEMGLSGWVGGRRVLVGNRHLLENHGVDVPSHDYEQRYRRDNRQLVYLSTGGELCAMFVVSYTADENIAAALRGLERAGVTLMVRTCDPNITPALLHTLLDVEEDAVRVLDTAAGRCYDALTAERAEENEALLACNGRLEGIGAALSLCRRVTRRVRLTGVLQMAGAGLGLLAAALALVTGAPLAPAWLALHMAVWALITFLAAGFHWEL